MAGRPAKPNKMLASIKIDRGVWNRVRDTAKEMQTNRSELVELILRKHLDVILGQYRRKLRNRRPRPKR